MSLRVPLGITKNAIWGHVRSLRNIGTAPFRLISMSVGQMSVGQSVGLSVGRSVGQMTVGQMLDSLLDSLLESLLDICLSLKCLCIQIRGPKLASSRAFKYHHSSKQFDRQI